jgi:hypothetical protein
MKPLLLLVLLGGAASAQSVALSVSPASVLQGGSATLTLTYADAVPTANLAGIQWTLTLPMGVTAGAPAMGAAGTAAGKVLSCGAAAPVICILIGDGTPLNQTAIGSGVLATVPLTVAASAFGTLTLSLSGTLGATAPGLAAAVSATSAALAVISKYDLNGDGMVNSADVAIMLSDAEAGTCTGAAVGVGDGKCGLADVELEILAALGVIH